MLFEYTAITILLGTQLALIKWSTPSEASCTVSTYGIKFVKVKTLGISRSYCLGNQICKIAY